MPTSAEKRKAQRAKNSEKQPDFFKTEKEYQDWKAQTGAEVQEKSFDGTQSQTKHEIANRPTTQDLAETGAQPTSEMFAKDEQKQTVLNKLLFGPTETSEGRQIMALQFPTVISGGAGSLANIARAKAAGIPYTAANTKNALGLANYARSLLSAKTLKWIGGVTLGSWIISWWAQAEAAEPLGFIMSDLIWEGKNTGNWSLFEEASTAQEELLNPSFVKNLVMDWTPILGPALSIKAKIDGWKAAKKVRDALGKSIETQQSSGESDTDRAKREAEEETQSYKDYEEWKNEERKKLVQWELAAKAEQRDEDAEFWAKEQEKAYEREAKDREALADFWLAYKKESQKLSENQRPSNLGFGLL